MNAVRKNINRGYMKLIVWQDACEYYAKTCEVFRVFPCELKRVASQQIASVDSVHRNIAEGYGRRSIREYLQFLNIALGSAGESVSGLHVYHASGRLDGRQFESLDTVVFKMENSLKRLIESLQHKQSEDTWQDSFIIRESNTAYAAPDELVDFASHDSSIPSFQYSTTKSNSRRRRK